MFLAASCFTPGLVFVVSPSIALFLEQLEEFSLFLPLRTSCAKLINTRFT
jgi:hypothetical protein